MQNFVLALDGEFIMADAGRNFRIIGDSDREKYEKIIVDRWVEMYIYYTVVCIYYICYMEDLI